MRSRYLTDSELAAIRQALHPSLWLPFQVAIETGLRVGDVAALRWVDLKGRTITYTAQKTKKRGKAVLGNGTAAALAAVRRGSRSPWLFPSPKAAEKHITRQALWRRLKDAAVRAGVAVDGTSPHSLRKVYGAELFKREGLEAARAGLQHSDLLTTEIYALSDWTTGENAKEPLLRRDLGRILRILADWMKIPLDKPPAAVVE